ncbi:MAG: LacI family DNA-binding transcriptional regulator [Clostridiales bacterium]|nr:LacI family DNA-binding transcriptional regulator [Clostridiales bacterium]
MTLQQIAEASGVSPALVSLALRDKYGVSEEMRVKIVMKALEMGFHGRARKSGNHKITLLINNMELLGSPFFGHVIRGIVEAASQNRFLLNIVCWYSDLSEDDVVLSIYNSKSDGIIVVNKCPPGILERIKGLNAFIAFVDYQTVVGGDYYDEVKCENFKAFFEIGDYLLSKGHKDILFVGNKDYALSFLERYEGFKTCMERRNAGGRARYAVSAPYYDREVNEDYIVFNREEFRRALAEGAPTAVACANDTVAGFVYGELERAGLKIPADVSVVSFDNTSLCEKLQPRLTCVAAPYVEIGRIAVDLLREKFQNPKTVKKTIMVSTRLVERESVRAVAE